MKPSKTIDHIAETSWGDRTIYIDTSYTPHRVVTVLLHEAVHVAVPSLDEDAVLAVEANQSALLTELGKTKLFGSL